MYSLGSGMQETVDMVLIFMTSSQHIYFKDMVAVQILATENLKFFT